MPGPTRWDWTPPKPVHLRGIYTLKTGQTTWDGTALADYAAKTVYVQPTFINELISRYGRDGGIKLVEFMLTHELSHFVQEISIAYGSKPNSSINGCKSLFVQTSPANGDVNSGFMAHAEVDAYAFLIMKDSIRFEPTLIQQWFIDEIEQVKASKDPDSSVVLRDFLNRYKSAKAVVKDFGSNQRDRTLSFAK